jgi:hypothetical protein
MCISQEKCLKFICSDRQPSIEDIPVTTLLRISQIETLEGQSTILHEELRNKIDIAAAECDRGEGLDVETAINHLLSRH